ncbi:MAG: hypothetical protein NUW22_13755 [Acidobacteria bacterium]|nr:hypothetical protein [Acidobacteriota bacterium]
MADKTIVRYGGTPGVGVAVKAKDLGDGTFAETVATATAGYSAALTITRPANQTAYTARDVLGGALELTSLGPSAGRILVAGLSLRANIDAIPAGMTTWSLYLYSVTPPSALADNAAFDLPDGDRASFLGKIAISALVDEGSTLYIEANGIDKQVKLAGTSLFAYLVTDGGFTPAANSEVYALTLHTRAV